MYRRSAQIESAHSILAAFFPSMVTKIDLAPSRQGRPISALRLRAGPGTGRKGVLLVAGHHARELLNPDVLVELVIDLLLHYLNDTDWVLGGHTVSKVTIRLILETLDVYVLSNVNPDGREYVFDADRMWRKSRAPLAGTTCVGVDLNRNYDLLWGIETVYMGQMTTSRSPCSYQYVGPAAFSEPETRNVRTLLDTRPIGCFVDVHSYSELILYPWGHARDQTSDPSQRFTLVDTSGWGVLPTDAPGYEEYITPRDYERFRRVAQNAAAAIREVRGRSYTPEPGSQLYPTTGTSSDYAYSRHVADTSKRKVYGIAFETGPYTGNPLDSFQPQPPERDWIAREATAGILSVLAQCICSIDFIGRDLPDTKALDVLRALRDERFEVTDAGRAWVQLLDRHQLELAGLALADEDLREEGRALIEAGAGVIREDRAISRELHGKVRDVLARLSRHELSEPLRADLDIVGRLVDDAVGRKASEVVTDVAFRPPERPRRRKRSR